MKLVEFKTTKNMTVKRAIAMSMIITGLVVLALFALKGFFPAGKGSIMLTDMYSQYIPLLYRFYDVVSGHKNLFMEFDILSGANLYGDTINEIINPFNYILFMFGRDNIYKAVNVIFLAYTVCMAGTATYAINKLCVKAEKISWIFGICYALSGYTAYNFQIIKWMYLPVLFPIFFVALIEMLSGKSGKKYSLLLAYQLALSIQLGFMTLLLSLFAGGIYSWYCIEKEERKKRLTYMGLCTVAGIALSAVVVVPMLKILFESSRNGQNQTYFEVMKQHGLDDIFERLYQVAHPVLLGVLIPALKNIKQSECKWLWCLLGLLYATVILQPANLLWHMGSYVCFPVRYGYMVVFVMCLIAVENTKEIETNKKPIFVITALISTVVLIAMVLIREDLLTQAFSCLAISLVCPKEALYVLLIIVILIVTTIVCRKSVRSLIVISATWGFLALAMICLPKTALIRQMNEEVYENYVYSPSEGFERVKEEENEHLNTGLVTGKSSLSGYIPTGNGIYQEAMNKLGYTTNWVSVSAEGGNSDEILSNVSLNGEIVPKEDIVVDKRKAKVEIKLPDSLQAGDLVFVPLANISGWSISTGILEPQMDGFVGIRLSDATNSITLKFRTPCLVLGLIISVMAAFFVAILDNERLRQAGFMSGLYKVLFSVGIVGVYVIPTVGMIIFMSLKACGVVDQPSKEVASYNFIMASETDDGLLVEVAGENLLLKKNVKVSADSIEGGKKGDFKPKLTIDGEYKDKSSRWSSENDWDNNDHFLSIDFKETQKVSFIRLMWERNNATKYAIEYSDDGENWQIAAEFFESPAKLVQNVLLDNPVNARYIRLHVTDVRKEENDYSLYYQNISLYEIEMYEELPDQILISAPSFEKERKINAEDFCDNLPEGYELKYSGCDYENIIDMDGNMADTVANVEVGVGFTLNAGGEEYQLPSLKVVVPKNQYMTIDNNPSKAYFTENNYPKEVCLTGEEIKLNECEVTEGVWKENNLGDEGYEIVALNGKVTITANSQAGISYAKSLITYLAETNNGNIPVGIIRDYPAYEIRGFGIDVGRRPISMELLYRIVDAMAKEKMNTLIVHLNDNQIIANEHVSTKEEAYALNSGFRLESDLGVTSTDVYYSKQEFAELINYAKEKGVSIVPEIDTPAHSLQFTKLHPEYALGNDPNAVDEMDVSKPEVVDFSKALWGEYLTSVFDECDTIHLGMDEYYGSGSDFVSYMNTMSDFTGEKKKIMWGSLSNINADYSSVDRDITIQIWDTSWADPEEMVNSGFSLINSLSCNMYLIPGTAYDNLDMEYLENKWQPYRFDTAEYEYVMPAWSPQIKGACYMLWNDFTVSVAGVLTEDDLYNRFYEPLECIAGKLW